MGCGCEDGYQDTHIGAIVEIFDRDRIKQEFSRVQKSVPDGIQGLLDPIADLLEKSDPDEYVASVKMEDGSEMSISGEVLPGGVEWARELLGKRIQLTMTQRPRRGAFSVAVVELAEA